MPNRRWDSDAIRRLLSSRTYLGENRYLLKEDPGNFAAEELLSPKRHDALTDETTFDRAQTKPRMRRSNGDYVLSHVATCGRCGAGMVGGFHSPSRGGKSYRRMRCSNVGGCRGGSSISADRLEEYVREQVASRVGDDVGLRALLVPAGKERAKEAIALADERLVEAMRQAARVASRSQRARQIADAEVDEAEQALELAEQALREIAVRHAELEDLPTAHEIRTIDEKLLRAISLGVVKLSVRPGRGTIEERVLIGFKGDDLDEHTWTLAA